MINYQYVFNEIHICVIFQHLHIVHKVNTKCMFIAIGIVCYNIYRKSQRATPISDSVVANRVTEGSYQT